MPIHRLVSLDMSVPPGPAYGSGYLDMDLYNTGLIFISSYRPGREYPVWLEWEECYAQAARISDRDYIKYP